MKRPTIKDLAETAKVSVATVNRVLAGSKSVKPDTREAVRIAAKAMGFYGLGAIDSRIQATRRRMRFGILLQHPDSDFYRNVASAIRSASERARDVEITLEVEFLKDLAPQHIATRILELGRHCNALALVAAVHPTVTKAVETLKSRNVPVIALISQLSATGQISYVGLDNWKVGRTAAWAFDRLCRSPGKIAVLIGNHRYRCQEMNESGFRSYFREYPSSLRLLEAQTTFESDTIAQELAEKLLSEHPDLVGLYIAGGGIDGALSAIRSSGGAGEIVVVGYDLTDTTKDALLDGTLTFLISHPLASLADRAVASLIEAVESINESMNITTVVPFEIFTRENI